MRAKQDRKLNLNKAVWKIFKLKKGLGHSAEIGPHSAQRMSDSDSDSATFADMPHDSSLYLEPLIVGPASGVHKQSWIVLHGRGDNAHSFAKGIMGFLNIPLPDGRTLDQHLPDVKFVFPTASYRRAKTFKRIPITQWFDIYSWNSTEHLDWQVEGLRETTAWVHRLMRREIEAVGAENVVLGGLSQGCASALISLLLWKAEPIKAVFGMSGWLPFQHVLQLAAEPELKDDVFERESTTNNISDVPPEHNIYGKAVRSLCQELDVDIVEGEMAKKIPIFIAHGGEDEKVDTHLGSDAADCLRKLGCNVWYREYPTLVHWMRGDELSDIVDFLNLHGSQAGTVSS